MAVRFFLICGGNPSTRRKPPTCRKSLTNFYHIMLYWIHLTWAGFEFTISTLNPDPWLRFWINTSDSTQNSAQQNTKTSHVLCYAPSYLLTLFHTTFNKKYKDQHMHNMWTIYFSGCGPNEKCRCISCILPRIWTLWNPCLVFSTWWDIK
jgi:cytochrome b561